ncbi:MAG TPA: hypothetical protein VHO66_08900 [Ruminiclostridium sp.]|nr:hypothetical protein [Ruminiclostridium sp.]
MSMIPKEVIHELIDVVVLCYVLQVWRDTAEKIAFIHDTNIETRKAELFAKVRKGQVRILLGSTSKIGAGTNMQDRLAVIHHLDCP